MSWLDEDGDVIKEFKTKLKWLLLKPIVLYTGVSQYTQNSVIGTITSIWMRVNAKGI